MDKLLKAENLDLRLTPYKVLATSTEDGMVEFIPSTPLSIVLSENKTITKFLATANPDSTGPFGMEANVLDTFVKSCAGYCVITYILGVGDRHLDNLLLTDDGRLFHVDYGYILGKDPKPFPPPMKVCPRYDERKYQQCWNTALVFVGFKESSKHIMHAIVCAINTAMQGDGGSHGRSRKPVVYQIQVVLL